MTESDSLEISVVINGETVQDRVAVRQSLADFLRQRRGLTGTKLGCEQGFCGACTVQLNNRIVRSCLTLAVQADGQQVNTIEGLTGSGAIADLQTAFHECNAAQCGFCTAGMLVSANELLQQGGVPERNTIRDFLSGNFCRCTGYEAIVDAVQRVARERENEPGR